MSVLGARAIFEEGGHVLADTIAFVHGKAVLRVLFVQITHQAVARDLGYDAGGGDQEALRITLDDRRGGAGESFDWQSVDQDMARDDRERFDCPAHGHMSGHQNIVGVNLNSRSLACGPGDLRIVRQELKKVVTLGW